MDSATFPHLERHAIALKTSLPYMFSVYVSVFSSVNIHLYQYIEYPDSHSQTRFYFKIVATRARRGCLSMLRVRFLRTPFTQRYCLSSPLTLCVDCLCLNEMCHDVCLIIKISKKAYKKRYF